MNTITLRAAVARMQALPWADYATRIAAGLRACWLAAQLLAMAVAILWAIAWEHRQQIRSAVIAAIAALVVAIQATHHAGQQARRLWARLLDASERFGRWYASLVAPVPASASIPAVPPAPDLSTLSARQLRELLGIRKHLPKARLLELAAAAA